MSRYDHKIETSLEGIVVPKISGNLLTTFYLIPNGGYNVHPVPPPNSEIKERIKKRYERERIKIEKLLTLGYTTSGDPRKIGTK